MDYMKLNENGVVDTFPTLDAKTKETIIASGWSEVDEETYDLFTASQAAKLAKVAAEEKADAYAAELALQKAQGSDLFEENQDPKTEAEVVPEAKAAKVKAKAAPKVALKSKHKRS
jgi:hypothetical protein